MNLRQLETFVAVADEGSFTRAADRLQVVQSAVSAAIRTLEGELGAELLRRGSRGATVTDAGAALLPEARATLAAAASARDAVDEALGGLRGTVVLGLMQSMRPPAPVPAALLASFAQTHPGVRVIVRHGGGSLEMAEQVRTGELDLAFISATGADPGLDLTMLSSEPGYLYCAAAHPLAGRRSVRLADLDEQTFADLPLRWGTRTVNDRLFAAEGLTRRIAYEINDTTTLVEFVRAGLAITLLPSSLVADPARLAQVPVAGAEGLTHDVFIASPRGRRIHASARALLAHVRASATARPDRAD